MEQDSQLMDWRNDTPGCRHRVHLNNAGAALMPQPVMTAIDEHMTLEATIGGYEAGDAVSSKIEDAYRSTGKLVGAKPANIAMVGNATEATSLALSAFDFDQGDVVITTTVDYSSNQIMLLNLVRRFGIKVIRAKNLPEDGVDPESVSLLIEEHRPKLVLMSWIPTHSGLIQDARSVGEICSGKEVPFILDACQAVGQIEIDVSELKCDFLAATSRKFLRGPRGMGFLYVSDRMIKEGRAPLFPDTHGATWIEKDTFRLSDDATRFEYWEFPVALLLGMGKAAEYALAIGLKTISARNKSLTGYARSVFAGLDKVKLLDLGSEQCAILSLALEQKDAAEAVGWLRNRGINTSSASRSSSVIDMDNKNSNAILRISPHYYNTKEEIDRCAAALKKYLT